MAENSNASRAGVSVDKLEDVSWDELAEKVKKEGKKAVSKANTDNIDNEDTEDTDESKKSQQDSDPIEAAIRAALDKERENLRQEAESRAKAAVDEQLAQIRQQNEEQQRVDALLNSFGNTVREIRANVKQLRFYDADQNEVEISDDVLEEKIVKPLQRYNQTGVNAASTQVLTALSQAALESLPDDARTDFSKRARGKPIKNWLGEYAEVLAPHTNWARAKDAEVEAAVKAAEARGFKRGKTVPSGQPSGEESKGNSSGGGKRSNDRKTHTGLIHALQDGEINQLEFNTLWRDLDSNIL